MDAASRPQPNRIRWSITVVKKETTDFTKHTDIPAKSLMPLRHRLQLCLQGCIRVFSVPSVVENSFRVEKILADSRAEIDAPLFSLLCLHSAISALSFLSLSQRIWLRLGRAAFICGCLPYSQWHPISSHIAPLNAGAPAA